MPEPGDRGTPGTIRLVSFALLGTLRRFGGLVSGLRRYAFRIVLSVAALQAGLIGVLVTLDELRKRREEPRDGFPWEDLPEVELESGKNRLKLYTSGSELYEAMLDEIEDAEREVFIETFIWKGDRTGRRFVEALARKAREGVEVYAVFDGLANAVVVPEEFKRFPEEIHTLHFRPLDGPTRFADPRSIFRTHRKILSVDGRVAFLGGFNIGSLYASGSWRDTHLRITGSEVFEVENAFIDFWNAHRGEALPEIASPRERAWNSDTVLHRNDPYLRIFPIRAVYLEAIDRASKNVYLSSAYFIPDRAFRASLKEAARRGADVQVLVPVNSNHVTADWLSRRHFHELLEAGVRVFGYENIMMHSKTATIDGVWSTVGTANIDRLSLLGNYEINLEIYSERLAGQMERVFELDKTNAREITLESWQNRPLPAKLAERALAGLEPLF
ncbi:MAG: phosphatidylserine/phosphatidylglycerophosphate/cardiolipin synthase family protein [Rubrobacter sp.]|nr:phosphatidylserine/phosphatidylglycerophosphate/cardiolipin synthase family protein [Rubrobacter sp.]